MLIDWFTVVAQALNFVVLVWLMKRFLYKPVLRAIDAREKRIAAELADARAKKAEAAEERETFRRKIDDLDAGRLALLKKATDEADAERHRLLDDARRVADALRAARDEKLRRDAHDIQQLLRRRTQEEVMAIARKALTDLATTSLEERVTEVFARRVQDIDGNTKSFLAEALRTSSSPALVRSAFDLSIEQRAVIQNALNATFGGDVRLRFETAPDVICGIDLATNGQRVGWSIADYLASLDQMLDGVVNEKLAGTSADATPSPKSEAATVPAATPVSADTANTANTRPASAVERIVLPAPAATDTRPHPREPEAKSQ